MMGVIGSDSDKYVTINFEETELRLGLPGGSDLKGVGSSSNNNNNNSCMGKRGFLETVDLKLELSSPKKCSGKDVIVEENSKANNLLSSTNDPGKPPAKAQVVGWPPIRSFRKNVMAVQKSGTAADDGEKTTTTTTASAAASTSGAAFVKVSMDGAPYLRKVDLKLYKSYRELSNALGQMFSSFTIGNCGSQGMKDFMNESKLVDLSSGSDFVTTYEDKDGDWMLVGDVPWELFVDSCKRLRIVKGSEAIGLAPRAVEKCKNKS